MFLLQSGLGTQGMREPHQESPVPAVKVCKGLAVEVLFDQNIFVPF